jgi:hypothetical protein
VGRLSVAAVVLGCNPLKKLAHYFDFCMCASFRPSTRSAYRVVAAVSAVGIADDAGIVEVAMACLHRHGGWLGDRLVAESPAMGSLTQPTASRPVERALSPVPPGLEVELPPGRKT